MKILLAASEAVPFCKTGGLADVVGALARRLGEAGHDVCLFLPKYRQAQAYALDGGMSYPLSIPLGEERVQASLRYLQWKSVSVYFIEHPASFDRDGLYGEGGSDFPDNDRRFLLFSRAVLEGAKAVGFKPDVVHLHDWQTAPAAAFLKRQYRDDPFFSGTGSLLTIHNLAYQGNFPAPSLALAGFGPEDFASDRFEFYGQFSFLKAGLVCADQLNTVSPTYAREIQSSPERGFGMEGLLRRRGADLHGVINGLDQDVWNPKSDAALERNYAQGDFRAGKAACKAALRRRCGLADKPGVPLLGIVSRLDRQKGLDLALAAVEPRLARCQLAVLGAGDPALAAAFAGLARRRPQEAYLHSSFDDAFARQVYSACDIFLMPSLFEPCGLGQMIAMRYGAVPVASRTGGLADTVLESSSGARRANGFLCEPGDPVSLGAALDRALAAFSGPGWDERVSAAMQEDFSWGPSLTRYLELYRAAMSPARAASA